MINSFLTRDSDKSSVCSMDEEKVPPIFCINKHTPCQDSLEPFRYLLNNPGKSIRNLLLDSFNAWLCVDPMVLLSIQDIVNDLHTASLVVDDIEDQSATRRGQPSAHIKFGTARALNAANYAYFVALEKVLELQSPSCVDIYVSEMLNLHRGQGRDILWRDTFSVVSLAEYKEMIVDKTGGLFRLAIRMLLAHSNQFISLPLLALSDNMAIYFQIRDDLINLASPSYQLQKGFCEDITEGKFSFIVLHSLHFFGTRSAEYSELQNILLQRTIERPLLERALQLLKQSKSLEAAYLHLNELDKHISQQIHELGGNSGLTKLMMKMGVEVEECRLHIM